MILRIESWLSGLPTVERDIIIRRFGLDGEPPQTLDSIGAKIGVSRERVRQIESSAIAKLREMIKACTLTPEDLLA